MRLLLLVALVGCAGESSWKLHDARGWPQPTWARTHELVTQVCDRGATFCASELPAFDGHVQVHSVDRAPR